MLVKTIRLSVMIAGGIKKMNNREIAKKHYPWMNDDHIECFEMLCDLFRGYQHVYGKINQSGDSGITINARNCDNFFGTVDYNNMTRVVVMSHDRCIRFSICPSGPRMLSLAFHKRHAREGDISERVPVLEDHIKSIRESR